MQSKPSPAFRFEIDETHDKNVRSFVASANGHRDFPLQNLPLGIFSTDHLTPRAGVAIGDCVLDLPAVLKAGLLTGRAVEAAEAASGDTLNGLLNLDAESRRALRRSLFALLSEGTDKVTALLPALWPRAECRMHLPARIGDFTDFFAGIHHATNAGRLFRPDNPLLPNYKYVPVGYHGRSSSIRVSGEDVRRPSGQRRAGPAAGPTVSPSRKLDFELELGIWVGAGNEIGEPIAIGQAHNHIAGFCLLNDWSARDIQAWEYQPLGPFLAKNFSTTVSPWVVTPEALAPYFTAQNSRLSGDPAPLPYLSDVMDQEAGALDIDLEVLLLSEQMRQKSLPSHPCTTVNTRELYWTFSQLITHHTVSGCNLRAGDLLGTGTISGPEVGTFGSLLEATFNGQQPITLPSGETRSFLEDGDDVIMRASCSRDGFAPIGFGECRGRIVPSV